MPSGKATSNIHTPVQLISIKTCRPSLRKDPYFPTIHHKGASHLDQLFLQFVDGQALSLLNDWHLGLFSIRSFVAPKGMLLPLRNVIGHHPNTPHVGSNLPAFRCKGNKRLRNVLKLPHCPSPHPTNHISAVYSSFLLVPCETTIPCLLNYYKSLVIHLTCLLLPHPIHSAGHLQNPLETQLWSCHSSA